MILFSVSASMPWHYQVFKLLCLSNVKTAHSYNKIIFSYDKFASSNSLLILKACKMFNASICCSVWPRVSPPKPVYEIPWHVVLCVYSTKCPTNFIQARIDPLYPRMAVLYCFGHQNPKSHRRDPEFIQGEEFGICDRVKQHWDQFLSRHFGSPVVIIGPIPCVQSFIIWVMNKGFFGAPPQIYKKII